MSAISSLASALGLSDLAEPATMGLSEFDLTISQEKVESLKAFQYWPETINDSKSAEYAKRSVPGGSHPLMQFVSGGDRVVSFVAVFTQAKNPEGSSLLDSILSGGFSLSLFDDVKHNIPEGGVATAIAWLRSFMLPEYIDGAAKPPPAAVVYVPGSGIIGAGGHLDSFIGVMTSCNVVYEAFHRNGAPRLIAVSLEFHEIVQTSPSWRFMGRDDELFAQVANAYVRPMQGGIG